MAKKVKKTEFQGWPCRDEFNPHIVRHLNPNTLDSQLLHAEVACFQEAYQHALALVLQQPGAQDHQKDLPPGTPENWLPLAYRLQPVFEDKQPKDCLASSKMGGIPDFRDFYNFTVSDAKRAAIQNKPKQPQQTIEQAIKRVWPQCAHCHKHMLFMGQFCMSPWLNAIYLSTNWKKAGGYGCYQSSGLGNEQDLRQAIGVASDIWYYIFFCDCGVYHEPLCNAHVITKTRFHYSPDDGMSKCLWPIEEYVDGLQSHMDGLGHDMAGKIECRVIKGMEYRFDYDPRGGCSFDEFWEAINDLAEFDYDSPCLYGRPRSQQEEKRFFCSNAFPGIHRQSPIIWWSDEEHDMDYQLYGCLRCIDHDQLYCRVDSSCT